MNFLAPKGSFSSYDITTLSNNYIQGSTLTSALVVKISVFKGKGGKALWIVNEQPICVSHHQAVTICYKHLFWGFFFVQVLEKEPFQCNLRMDENRPNVSLRAVRPHPHPLPKKLSPGRSNFNQAAGQTFAFHHGRHGGQAVAFHQPACHTRRGSALPRRDNDS